MRYYPIIINVYVDTFIRLSKPSVRSNKIKKLLIPLLVFTSCQVSESDTCSKQEIVCDISVKYPEYVLMDSSHFIYYDLHTDEYDDSIFTAKYQLIPFFIPQT